MDYNAGIEKCSRCGKQFIPDMYHDDLLYFCEECTNTVEKVSSVPPHTPQANVSDVHDEYPNVDTNVTYQTTPLPGISDTFLNASTSANVTYQTIQTNSTYGSDCINKTTSPTVILQTTQDTIDHETISQESYGTESLLKEHKETPDTDRRYPCTKSKCNKTFKTKKSLKTHILKMHREKLFSCDMCPKIYVLKSLLNQHKATHNPEKPYPCPKSTCNKSYIYKHDLLRHISMKHKDTHFTQQDASESRKLETTKL